MSTPAVQRLGSAVLLQGPAVHDLAYLVGLGLRYRSTVDGTAPAQHHLQLLSLLADMAEATLTPDVREQGTSDVRSEVGSSDLKVKRVDTAAAARLLGITTRQTRRLASHLGGRRVKGNWSFDRAAVVAEAQRRSQTTMREGP